MFLAVALHRLVLQFLADFDGFADYRKCGRSSFWLPEDSMPDRVMPQRLSSFAMAREGHRQSGQVL
jgi:hypothetical protein